MDALILAKELLKSCLQLGQRADALDYDTLLMGHFPELNSLTVMGIISGIEEQIGCSIDDAEISADIFETVGTLVAFIDRKLSP